MAPSAVPAETVDQLPLNLKASKKSNGLNKISTLQLGDGEKADVVLRTFRCLIADLCEQFKGGHPG
jgi:dihydroxyacetone synthase